MKNLAYSLYKSVGVLAISCAVLWSSGIQAEIQRDSKTLTHRKGSDQFQNIRLEAKEVETYTRYERSYETWYEWECDDPVGGDGKGDWKGYYNVPQSQKAKALADAIKGIGTSRANTIVDANINAFIPRPRSWNAFRNEISRIESRLKLDGLYYEVTVKYAKDNIRNLGYASSGYSNSYSQLPDLDADPAVEFANASDPWDGYFNKPKDQKGAALSNAVRGIGVSTGDKIVDANINAFMPKPRSWEAFKDEVKRIEREARVSGLYDNVVTRYGSTNKENLYGSSRDDQRPDPQPRPEPSCRWVQHSGYVVVPRTDTRVVRTYVSPTIDVEFTNYDLLNDESEKVVVIWDGREFSFSTSSALNRYIVNEATRGVYTLTGQGRKPVRPELSDFTYSLGGDLILRVNDKRAQELIEHSADYSLTVSVTVESKKSGWCKGTDASGSKTISFDSGSGDIALKDVVGSIESDTKYRVKVSFERKNTKFFSKTTGEGISDWVKN